MSKVPAPGRLCEHCGATIAQPPVQGRRRRTCSDACRQALRRSELARQAAGRTHKR